MGFFEFFGGIVIFGILLVSFPRSSFLVVLALYLMYRGVPLFANDLVGGWFGALATVFIILGTCICFAIEAASLLKWLKSEKIV